MPVINKFPRLEVIVADLSKRLTHLERSKRTTAMAVASWDKLPGVQTRLGYPQSGDMAYDAQTGSLWVYAMSVNTLLFSSVTYAGTPAVNITVYERKGIQPGQLLTIAGYTLATISTSNVWDYAYAYQVSSSYVATTGGGAVTGSFVALTNNGAGLINPYISDTIGNNFTWSLPPNGTILADSKTNGIVMAANWRQLVPAYDLIARPTTFTSASGANVAVAGSNLGGIGQVPAKGYKPTR